MFCRYCGKEIPDHAQFCRYCGKAAVRPKGNVEDRANVKAAGMNQGNHAAAGVYPGNDLSEKPGKAGKGGGTKDKISAGLGELKNDKKKLGIAGIIAAAVIVVLIAGHTISTNRKIGKLEDAVYRISSSGEFDEDEIIKLYKEYDSLSESNKRKVANRDVIINAYTQVEALIAQREQAAAQVDMLIESIDYTNQFSKASSALNAVAAYNDLDEKTKEYVESYDELEKVWNEIKGMNIPVTAQNFYDLFSIGYAVGDKNNYGDSSITPDGSATIDWSTGTVTPNYDVSLNNDYATPVHVYVSARYPNLTSQCSFYINLHQTYKGLGIVDSDSHEYKFQDGVIQYDSSQEIGDYIIYVEDNNASGGWLDVFGWSMDWSDMTHSMEDFDVSRVEISDISGSVTF